MAEIDLPRFGMAVKVALSRKGLSYGDAVARWPETNKALWSRAVNGKALSAGNYLLVCRYLNLRAWAFVRVETGPRLTMKSIAKQAVTAADKRETGARA